MRAKHAHIAINELSKEITQEQIHRGGLCASSGSHLGSDWERACEMIITGARPSLFCLNFLVTNDKKFTQW